MAIVRINPTSPGRRNATKQIRDEITKHKPEKSLLVSLKSMAGRNNVGKITVRHRGGGHARHYRLVDFKQTRYDQPATVVGIEYDPNRSANIALIQYQDGTKAYILAAQDLKVGATLVSSQTSAPIEPGNRLPLEKIPVGLTVYNIELEPGRGGMLVRSAGTSAAIMAIEGKYAQLKMPSGEMRLIPKTSMASIGQIGNVDHGNVRWGKAGRTRWYGIRPSVRGKAMNPVDHPHGGGEGLSPIGMKAPKTPWGKKALGVRTRRKHKKSNSLIIRSRRKQR